ncbi:MAG: rhodanese-like domain-containing protein [Acidobacteria bacterium]|nr:rhodanese-like domain-containing protein [Acidobacteriota bacterium]MYJ05651.1 rhodanese-like domain-containing protein [Acidobacteriota bacterium]
MSVTQVDVRQAQALRASEDYTYVDVRSIPEYDAGHPAGAHNVPLLHRDPATGMMQPNVQFLDVMQANYAKDAKLLVGCQMGGRSSQAAQILVSAGYTNVCNVLGGFGGARDRYTGQVLNEGWADAGLPVDTEPTPGGSYGELSGG